MSFNAEISRFSRNTQKRIRTIRRGVTLKLLNAVILDTPVLTGRLRGNWRIAEGHIDRTANNREDKPGTIVMAEVQKTVLASKDDTSIYLANSLPYAHRIEYEGWSHTKAPDGMVRKNVTRFNGLIKLEAAKS